jgi:hypothetical protein
MKAFIILKYSKANIQDKEDFKVNDVVETNTAEVFELKIRYQVSGILNSKFLIPDT